MSHVAIKEVPTTRLLLLGKKLAGGHEEERTSHLPDRNG